MLKKTSRYVCLPRSWPTLNTRSHQTKWYSGEACYVLSPRTAPSISDRAAKCGSEDHGYYRTSPVAVSGTRRCPTAHTFQKASHSQRGYSLQSFESKLVGPSRYFTPCQKSAWHPPHGNVFQPQESYTMSGLGSHQAILKGNLLVVRQAI